MLMNVLAVIGIHAEDTFSSSPHEGAHLSHYLHVDSTLRTGSNLTVEVMHNTLVALTDQLAEGTSLPRTVHIQLDNCWRENKNR